MADGLPGSGLFEFSWATGHPQIFLTVLILVAGAVAAGLLMWLVHLVTRNGVGFDDVKLTALTGWTIALDSPGRIPWVLLLALILTGLSLQLTPTRRPRTLARRRHPDLAGGRLSRSPGRG